MLGLGAAELLVIGAVLTLLFGSKKIPGIARGVGEAFRNFRGEVGEKRVEPGERSPELGEGEHEDRGQGP